MLPTIIYHIVGQAVRAFVKFCIFLLVLLKNTKYFLQLVSPSSKAFVSIKNFYLFLIIRRVEEYIFRFKISTNTMNLLKMLEKILKITSTENLQEFEEVDQSIQKKQM